MDNLVFCGTRRILACGTKGHRMCIPGAMKEVALAAEVALFCQRSDSDDVLLRLTERPGTPPAGWCVVALGKVSKISGESSQVITLPAIIRHAWGVGARYKVNFYRSHEMLATDAIVKPDIVLRKVEEKDDQV